MVESKEIHSAFVTVGRDDGVPFLVELLVLTDLVVVRRGPIVAGSFDRVALGDWLLDPLSTPEIVGGSAMFSARAGRWGARVFISVAGVDLTGIDGWELTGAELTCLVGRVRTG
jgi:hypothetical protein